MGADGIIGGQKCSTTRKRMGHDETVKRISGPPQKSSVVPNLASITSCFFHTVFRLQQVKNRRCRLTNPTDFSKNLHFYQNDRRDEESSLAEIRCNRPQLSLFARHQPKSHMRIEMKLHRSRPSFQGHSTWINASGSPTMRAGSVRTIFLFFVFFG